ncbi:MAG: hypothetical protein C3L24_12620 [Candidatus Sedimenticola endophacoides]|uniref:Aromatic hydrocarbon degradation protein n=1 Tax=Candidatus Sedimenticola endophacoides TaxID=2548426 RepID=A0A6N4DJH5_9GAMM|nr:MAG: hypothetical protein C3L24_12620 [Candidatus Sedimenticola endophacoides]
MRAVYSKGKVISSDSALGSFPLGRSLEGDSFDFGYNLALHYRASEQLDLSATYRSKVELTLNGDARLTYSGTPYYNSGASVTVPIPAALNLAAAYTFDRTTLELVLERTYWSAYKNLDFNYASDISAIPVVGASLAAAFDDPKTKNWSDSDTIRLGITHELDSRWTLMAGFAYDKTPVPRKYAGYELPDSDSKVYSFGARYRYDDQLSIGAAFLYDDKETLDLTGSGNTESLGTLASSKFTDTAAYLLTMGIEYKF